MIEFKSLEDVKLETLHNTFVKAFSDYQVEIDLPIEKFGSMLQRRGYAPELSIGAFDGAKLVGFVLNGLRSWGGARTLYDCGTGVVPEYRKQGITSTAFDKVLSLFSTHQIEQYLLEVLRSNQPALDLYRKQGFCTTRSFGCFQIDRSSITAVPLSGVSFTSQRIEDLDWSLLKTFGDSNPSWQNSIESVTAVPDSFEALVAHAGGALAGYGIIEKSSGDVPQLAVRQEYRRRGIGTNLVHELAKHTDSSEVVLLNIDTQCESMQQFLHSLGWENFTEQYEMVYPGG
ncbi:MAG: GNAT family N-acetyltransferase [Spirochaetia bacterium]